MQGLQRSSDVRYSHKQKKMNVCFLAFSFCLFVCLFISALYYSSDLGKGFVLSGLGLPTLMLTETILQRPTYLRQSLIEAHFLITLGCIKGMIKTNHHRRADFMTPTNTFCGSYLGQEAIQKKTQKRSHPPISLKIGHKL